MVILLTGLFLGGIYALIAMGLSLQYGVARIMNLASGEMLVAGAFAGFWVYTAFSVSPYVALFFVVPLAFAFNWLIYNWLLLPLVRRAKNRGQLEVDSILATFGMSFVLVGVMLMAFGGSYFSYSWLARPIELLGSNYSQNRVLAFAVAAVICGGLYLLINRTRLGLSIRAVAVDPRAAGLVAIDVKKVAALTFALGGAVAAAGGTLLSTFLTFDASIGVVFTIKALVIVIMGGVGDIRGAIVAALALGLAETLVATLLDPGLTLAAAYLLFILILLFRPQGLFGRSAL
ncbi:branched-chain amino acid ABC transporter permease [Marinospirillum alkaliphilum]|uniref:Amino acid/amide ABC transporter membrane protein 1, HAAT family (TC 3.A.1.4.-) n=1 Tax=Marinospirillum alkaliphilum DSM 21637 TaxID=1122209 RepID=A0A1K1TGK5_9GAMM|nr:branched-chain amino acid ABC transporter permease [Marinospirillum alkaliphilum]SFW99704.1 amino acid/amide ABC transporter membrane protein 1, HAAT family (TC 3.A.1.4.-) [Marinospirillum alkaliphilum DSM 21637]